MAKCCSPDRHQDLFLEMPGAKRGSAFFRCGSTITRTLQCRIGTKHSQRGRSLTTGRASGSIGEFWSLQCKQPRSHIENMDPRRRRRMARRDAEIKVCHVSWLFFFGASFLKVIRKIWTGHVHVSSEAISRHVTSHHVIVSITTVLCTRSRIS